MSRLRLAAVLLALGLSAAACGGGSGGATGPTAPTSPDRSQIVAIVASVDLYTGAPQRVTVGLVTNDNRLVSYGTATFAFSYLGASDQPAQPEPGPSATATFIPTYGTDGSGGEEPRITLPSEARGVYEAWRDTVVATLADFHREYPLREGLGKEELRSRRFGSLGPRQFLFLLQALEEDGVVRVGGHTLALAAFRPAPDTAQREMLDRIEGVLRAGGYQPPTWKEIAAGLAVSEREKGELLHYLLQTGKVVKVGEDLYFHRDVVNEVRRKVADFLKQHGEITVGQMRDLLQSSRKYALPLLEYLDRERVTRRVGDKRVLVRD
mgnify:CR=1 FL=1